jgi:hypothetical protein
MNTFTNRLRRLGRQSRHPAPMDVNLLCLCDDVANGLTESHAAGIFSSVGDLVVSAPVQHGYPLTGWLRLISVTRHATRR